MYNIKVRALILAYHATQGMRHPSVGGVISSAQCRHRLCYFSLSCEKYPCSVSIYVPDSLRNSYHISASATIDTGEPYLSDVSHYRKDKPVRQPAVDNFGKALLVQNFRTPTLYTLVQRALRKMHYSVYTTLLWACVAHAAVHEALSALPYGWSASSLTVPDSTQLRLHVALKYQHMDDLEAKLAAVSTPGSPEYGHYIDLAEQNAIFAPSNSSKAKVVSWLQGAGAKSITSTGDTVSFLTTVGEANKILGADFGLYSDGETVKLRTTTYSVPDDVADAVDLVSPTTYFGSTKALQARPRTPPLPASKTKRLSATKRQLSTSCETSIVLDNETFPLITPQCLKELYNVGNYTVDPSAGSTIAFGSFLNQSASYSDLALFEQIFDIPSQNFSLLALINGGVNYQDPAVEQDGEANLDVQNIIGLVDGLPVGEYITGGLPPFIPDLLEPNASTESNEPYLPYYQYLLSQPNSNLPYVITNSYGDHEDTVPQKYATRVCNMIGMMGLRGRTILESSGDEGVGAVCRSNQGSDEPQCVYQWASESNRDMR